ncbi:hypothetical protein BXZ70DRAFT_758351 [Cristinia sonorae]|uniref:DUF6534 domain-containing protein n=1 Tax=Cristinia sonorae TaxID=1940300 RepID=A0A8K0XS09_9AGAR|nr:hypothetical protein BXZ70DRAFT_758351 [Cristinia sonorae]
MAEELTVADIYGSAIIIIFLTFGLYGIVIAQVYEYLINENNKDPWFMRVGVGLITLLETIHTALEIHFLYFYAITCAGDPSLLNQIVWGSAAKIVCESIMVVLVHSFYIRRIWIMSGRKLWLVAILVALLVIRTGFGLATATLMFIYDHWDVFREHAMFTAEMSGSLLVVADFSIAASMIYYLWGSQTLHERTNRVIHTLMAYSINSGLLTMLSSFSLLITFVVFPNRVIFAGLFDVASKLYANALLGSLNMRGYLRDKPRTEVDYSSFRMGGSTTVQGSRQFLMHSKRTSNLRPIEIYQQTSKAEMSHSPPIHSAPFEEPRSGTLLIGRTNSGRFDPRSRS